MNTIKYRAFVEAARCGNLTTAAQLLNYTQPGISHMICSLEKEYGFPLLNRNRNGVTLTENGKHLYNIYVRILEAEDELKNTVSQLHGTPVGSIRIGAFFSVITQVLPDIIEDYAKRYPQITLHLYEAEMKEQIEMLRSGAIDIGFFSLPAPNDLLFYPLEPDELVIILSPEHELAKAPTISPQDLLRYHNELILPHEDTNENIRLIYGDNIPPLHSKYSAENDPTIISLVNKGLGIGIVPRLLLNAVTTDIAVRSFAPPKMRTLALTVSREKAAMPAIKEFIALVSTYHPQKAAATLPYQISGSDSPLYSCM